MEKKCFPGWTGFWLLLQFNVQHWTCGEKHELRTYGEVSEAGRGAEQWRQQSTGSQIMCVSMRLSKRLTHYHKFSSPKKMKPKLIDELNLLSIKSDVSGALTVCMVYWKISGAAFLIFVFSFIFHKHTWCFLATLNWIINCFPPKLKPNFSISSAANWFIKVVPEESTEGKKCWVC